MNESVKNIVFVY